MNFLLHHHVAVGDLGDELSGIGAMLPDLWRLADRRVRAVPTALPPLGTPGRSEAETFAPLVAGVLHHLEADAWFHRSLHFVSGERTLSEALRGGSLKGTRMGLFGHVAWELCLDGALLEQRGLEPTLARIDSGLRQATSAGASTRVADHFHFGRVPREAADREAFELRMGTIFERLREGSWIASYMSPSGLARVLGGIRVRLGLKPIPGGAIEQLEVALAGGLAAAREALVALLADRRQP